MDNRLTVRHAIVSFCPDLTDPQVTSQPVGLIGIAYAERHGYVFCGVCDPPLKDRMALAHDPFSQSVLFDLQGFLQAELRQGLRDTGPENLCSWLHGQLRNTLHVSLVSEARDDAFADDAKSVLDGFLELFTDMVIAPIEPVEERPLPDIRLRPIPATSEGHTAAAA